MFNVQCSMFAFLCMNDLKFAFGQLLKNPGFTTVAVLTLALGIGANLALFALVDEQFLRPRPVKRPEELWRILPSDASGDPKFFNFSPPYREAIYKDNRVFNELITIHGLDTRLRTSDGWEDRFGHIVSANYFNFLGVQPVIGRGFLPEDDKPGADLVAVIGYRFWQEQFLGNPAIVGKTVNLDGHVFEIIGVAPPGFIGIGSHPPDFLLARASEELFFSTPAATVIGRLRDGISPAVAANSLAPIVQAVTKSLHAVKYPPLQIPEEASNNSDFTRVALLRAGYGLAD